jgi:hypothetical protein|tara:strand:- start:11284 stop:11703 length:420 start_codon:yes stop_codon:yes gene_type:complete
MIKLPYASKLYKSVSEYIGRKYDDITSTLGSAIKPSGLELALAGVHSNPMGNQYGPYDGMFYAKSNGCSSKPTIKRMGLDGRSNNVYVEITGGGRLTIRPMNGKRRKVKEYVRGMLDANGISYKPKDVSAIVKKLKNPS